MKLITINKKPTKHEDFVSRPRNNAPCHQPQTCSKLKFGMEGCCTSAATKYSAWKAAARLQQRNIWRGRLLQVCGWQKFGVVGCCTSAAKSRPEISPRNKNLPRPMARTNHYLCPNP